MERGNPKKVYLNKLRENLYYGKNEIADIEELIGHPAEKVINMLSQNLRRLKDFEVPKEKSSKQVQKGWNILDKFIKEESDWIDAFGLNVIVYGSLIYGDPKNMDYDIGLFTYHDNSVVHELSTSWTNKLDKVWEEIGEGGHMNYVSLERIKEHCEALNSGNLDYIQKHADEIASDFELASALLNGKLLRGNTEILNSLKKSLIELSMLTPELAAMLVFSLQDTLKIRKSRRR